MEHGRPIAYKNGCRCEVCVQAKQQRDRDYYERNKDKVKAKIREYRSENPDRVADTNKRYREANAEQIQERKKVYYQENVEQEKARVKEWREANPEQARANSQRWKDENREKVRESNMATYHRRMESDPEAVRKYRRDWAKTPKGVLANRLARHARRGATTDREYAEILYNDPCCFCGTRPVEIDHITPISEGGTGDWTNLTAACRVCNASKNDRSLLAFVAS